MTSKRNREPLPFKLVGMTEEDLYRELDNLDKSGCEYVDFPSDLGSDNDNDFGDPDQELDVLPPSDEIVVAEEPYEMWDPEDLISLSNLRKLWKIE